MVRQRLVLAVCLWIVLSLAYLDAMGGNDRPGASQPSARIVQTATGPVAADDYGAIVRETMLAGGSIRRCR